MHRRLLIVLSVITIGFVLAIIISLTSSNAFGFYHNMLTMMSMSSDNSWQIWSLGSMIRGNGSISMLSNMMMTQEPKDVIIKVKSNQIVPAGMKSEIALLVLDKETQKPLTGAQVLVGIERGVSMTTMEMIDGSMFEAEEEKDKGKSSGIYKVIFTPDSEGHYTIHTHVIPFGNSMHSMMDNHLDIGIIVE